jgi:hypothetical protein
MSTEKSPEPVDPADLDWSSTAPLIPTGGFFFYDRPLTLRERFGIRFRGRRDPRIVGFWGDVVPGEEEKR